MSQGYPKVVLIGRTNVGKSALFNRVSNRARSIVFERDGVTRDYVHEVVSWKDTKFDLVDAGGLPLGKQEDPILVEVQKSVLDLIKTASLVLFVCDAKSGLSFDDKKIAKILHKAQKKVFLLLNKSDNSASEENIYEFVQLDFKDSLSISALHGRGIREMLDSIVERIPVDKVFEADADYKVSIIGRPNVGKSSLMNILMNEERSIVSEVPGTTREAISEKISFSSYTVSLTDTAGIRRQKKIDDDLEGIMVKSSLKSVRDADIVMVVVDASQGKLVDQELKLLFYAYAEKKCVILLFNKVDLLTPETRELLEHQLKEYDFILKKVSKSWISCKDRKNIHKVTGSIQKVWECSRQQFDSEKLDEIVLNYISKKPLYRNKIQLKIHRIAQNQDRVPNFSVKVNRPEFFGPDQLSFIENMLRRNYDLQGCPVRFNVYKGR